VVGPERTIGTERLGLRPLRVEDAAELKREWDEVVTAVGTALVFRG
jgi:hypothetical protein